MAKKGKPKISKVKRNNQTTNKMKKQGKLRLQRHKGTAQKQRTPQQPQVEYSSDSSESGEEWRDMLDEDEQRYMMSRLAKQPQLLAHVPHEEPNTHDKSSKKRKVINPRVKPPPNVDSGAESDLELKYEQELADRPPKRMRALLPIKTKHGLEERTEEVEDSESEQEDDRVQPAAVSEEQDELESDSGLDAETQHTVADDTEEVSAVQLLAARRDRLQHEKLRIGALCSSLLECPEKKLKNLYPILYLMDDRLKDDTLNLHSVRKLATLSACEVFTDILPEYPIRHQDYSNVKLKKDTLALYKFEKEMLEFYKRYLQRLEKAAFVLKQKKGDTRKPDEASKSLALVSLSCMCQLLIARPHFNYATNIAQSVVPYLACRAPDARRVVTDACVAVFTDDRRGDITLTIVRLLNQLVKRRGERLPASALDCLLRLNIRDVDLDAADALQRKKKADEKHKKRIINLSKKEKKRAKKLKEVERELLETEAKEDETARRRQLTEVTKAVFHIYFRLLKEAPHSKLLEAALNGIAKFAHVINLEYYSDLVAILTRLLQHAALSARMRLLVVRAVLGVLGGAGDALAVDPAVFHRHLYQAAITAHDGNRDCEPRLVLECICQMVSRARRVSPHVVCAFTKRCATIAAQLAPNAALACLAIVHQLATQCKSAATLLEMEPELGVGRFDALCESPEHCGAPAAALHELCVLARHYHPAVRAAAAAAAAATATAATPTLTHFNRSPIQILCEYDGSQMSLKPAVPPPPPQRPPTRPQHDRTHTWTQTDLQHMCDTILHNASSIIQGNGSIS